MRNAAFIERLGGEIAEAGEGRSAPGMIAACGRGRQVTRKPQKDAGLGACHLRTDAEFRHGIG